MAEMALLTPILTSAAAAAGTVAVSSALSPKAPKPEPVKRMPDPFGTEAADAEKRKALGRRGRGSTLLDDESSDSSPTYVHDVLGQ